MKFEQQILKSQQDQLNHLNSMIDWSLDDLILKARSGVYANTPENRKLGRVGQKYGTKKEVEKKDKEDKEINKYSVKKYKPAPEDKLSKEDFLEANEAGLRHKGTDNYWRYYTPSLQIAYDLGYENVSLKDSDVVAGIRYGEAPEKGISTNYSENRSEKGLSLAQISGEKEIGSSNWFKDRKAFEYRGLKLPYKGSDGEPLILPFHINLE